MDLLSFLRTLGGLGVVLGILAAALWIVRRFDLRLPGRALGPRDRRLELIETMPIDGRRMVALMRRDGREHLILIAPEGHLMIESGVIRDDVDHAAAEARREAREAASLLREQQREQSQQLASENFGLLIDRTIGRATPVVDRALARATPVIDRARARAKPLVVSALARAKPVIDRARTRTLSVVDRALIGVGSVIDRVRSRPAPVAPPTPLVSSPALDRAPPPPTVAAPSAPVAQPTQPHGHATQPATQPTHHSTQKSRPKARRRQASLETIDV